MPPRQRTAVDLPGAPYGFNSAAVAVGTLYVTTHSVAVTIAGTSAAAVLCAWRMWLTRRGEYPPIDPTGEDDVRQKSEHQTGQ